MDMTTQHLGEGMDGKWATHKGFRVERVLRIEHGKLWNRYASNRAQVRPTAETLGEMPEETAVQCRRELEKMERTFAQEMTKDVAVGKFIRELGLDLEVF